MPRPEDYGDPFPSDQGDFVPLDPTVGFAERDYRIRLQRENSGRVPGPVIEGPDLRTKRERPEPRPVWQAYIVKRVQNNQYIVLRQDGKRLLGYVTGDDAVYDVFRVGDQVSIVASQKPDVYMITGGVKRQEMASICVSNSLRVGPTDIAAQIELDTMIQQTGEDEVGINLHFDFPKDGGVRVRPDISGQYELSVIVAVVYEDAATIDENNERPKVIATCVTGDVDNSATAMKPRLFNFDRSVGFKAGWNQAQCETVITIDIDETDMMMYSPAGGEKARWTYNPKTGGDISVGTQSPQGWVKILSNGEHYVWLGHGEGKNKIKFPGDEAPVYSYMYVDAVEGECVKLAFSKGGGSGSVTYYDCNSVCQTLVFDKGLIISGPGIQAPPSQRGTNCQDSLQKDWTCTP